MPVASLPQSSETILVPAAPFLEQLERLSEPDILDGVLERFRGLRRLLRRALAPVAHALAADPVPAIFDGVVEPDPRDDSAAARALDGPTDAAADDLNVTQVLAALEGFDVAPQPNELALPDEPLLGYNQSGETVAARPPLAILEATAQPRRWDPIAQLLGAIAWMRREPLLTLMIVTGIAFMGWARHAMQRAQRI